MKPPGCRPEGQAEGQAGQGCSLLICITNFASQPISEVVGTQFFLYTMGKKAKIPLDALPGYNSMLVKRDGF